MCTRYQPDQSDCERSFLFSDRFTPSGPALIAFKAARGSLPADCETYAGARSALGLSILTGISPLTGFLCEMVLAWRFGASAITDGYRVAYLLVGFAWMVFISQVLPNVVVPIHAEFRAKGRETDAWRVSFAIANLTLLFTASVSLAIFLWPGRLAQLLGPGLQGQARASELLLVRWFAISYLPLTWSGIAIGILYTQGIFWVATVASSLGNLLMLAFVGIMGSHWGVWSLIAGTLGGSLVTLVMCATSLVPLMRRVGARCLLTLYPRNVSLLPALALVVPLAISAVVAQLCGVITSRVLSPLPVGTVAIYGYAWKMGILATMLPLSLSTVLFPRFAQAWHSASPTAFPSVCVRALRTTLFLAVPVAGILYILRTPIVSLMFQRGAFSSGAVNRVSVLFGYMMLLGGVPSALIACTQKILCATRTMRVSTYGQISGLALLVVGAKTAAAHYGAVGVLVLYMANIWLSLGVMFFVLSNTIRSVHLLSFGFFGMQLLVALGGAIIFEHFVNPFVALSAAGQVTGLLVLCFRAGLIASGFAAIAWLIRLPEAIEGFNFLNWQIQALVRGIMKHQAKIRKEGAVSGEPRQTP